MDTVATIVMFVFYSLKNITIQQVVLAVLITIVTLRSHTIVCVFASPQISTIWYIFDIGKKKLFSAVDGQDIVAVLDNAPSTMQTLLYDGLSKVVAVTITATIIHYQIKSFWRWLKKTSTKDSTSTKDTNENAVTNSTQPE